MNDEYSPLLALQAKIELTIVDIDVYNFLYARFVGSKIPSLAVVIDLTIEEFKNKELTRDEAVEIVQIFIVNVKYLGLLQTIAGAKRLLTLEHALESIPESKSIAFIIKENTEDLIQINNENGLPVLYNLSFSQALKDNPLRSFVGGCP